MQPGSILKIALVFFVIVLLPVHDAARCCKIADIQFTVDCVTTPGIIQWQWRAPRRSKFGFCVSYNCRQPTDGDYCSNNDEGWPQECFNSYKESQSHDLIADELGITDGESCWFWIKDTGVFGLEDYGCSEVIHCNFSSASASSSTEVSPTIISLAETSSSNFNPSSLIPLSATTLMVSDEMATSAMSMYSSPFMSPSLLSETVISVSSQTSRVTVDHTRGTYLTTSRVTESSQPTSIIPTHRSVEMTTETILPTVASSLGSKAQIAAQHKISFFVTFSCILVFVTLLLTITLFVYWNKRVQKNFETSMKTRMEKECCLEIYDIAKESESEVEIVKDHGCEDDLASITEDNLYMYNKILYPWNIKRAETLQQTPLVLSQLSIFRADSDIEDGSVISLQLSNDYYCTNSGSAGRCSQSNPASSQQSHTSNTPVSSNDDITDDT